MKTTTFDNSVALVENQSPSNDQITEVKTWLVSQFDSVGKYVPKFELNPQSVSYLHNLVTLSRANTRAASIVKNDLQQKAVEYSSQAARIREILENIGLGEETLPPNVVASTEVLAIVANLLNLRDIELTFGDLCLKKTEAKGKRIQTQRESKFVLDHTRKAITKMAYYKRIVQQLEDDMLPCEDQMRKWEKNLALMASKEKQYKQQLTNFKELLNRVGYTPEISHRSLVEMAEYRDELEEKTYPIVNTLRSYRDLPPDTTLAALNIENKAKEYEVAEKYLEDLLLLALETTD